VVQALYIAFTRVLRAQPGLLAEWQNTKWVTAKPGLSMAIEKIFNRQLHASSSHPSTSN